MNDRLNEFGRELGELLEYQNISINDFASRIGITPKNLIDIINGKAPLSFNTICNIAFISEVPVSYICNVEESFKICKNIDNYLQNNNLTIRSFINKFNYKELKDKYNVTYKNERNDYSIAESILKYLRVVDPVTITNENNHIFYKSKNDKPELLALWLERCYRSVQQQDISEYKKDNINTIVEFIKEEANNLSFNKEKLVKVFNDNGIFLAIEEDLTGSKIRGAFRVLNDKPAIYITTKHKRYADIYFALLHELAHCKSDFNRAKSGSIISLENSTSEEDYEKKADDTAYNWMVNQKDYEQLKSTLAIDDCVYPACFVVYRLAKDNILNYNSEIYQKYNSLIEN